MLNHRWIVFLIELVLNAHAADLTEWSVIPSSSLPRLPRPEYGAALCVLNESMQTLHILGGQQNQMQWIEYHLADNTVIDHGDNTLPDNIAAVEASTPIREHSANYWTQLDGVLYYILKPEDWNVPSDQRQYTIYGVDVNAIGESNSMQYWQTIPYATQTHDHCIASHANKLIVVGGMKPLLVYDGVANMAVHDFTTEQWMTGPSMKQPRQEPSCVVNTAENALYVSGGFDDSVPLNSIEKVSLTDIASQSWDYIAGNLTVGVYGHVMVYYPDDNTILVIGGWDHSNARDEIQRIDCETGAVTVTGALEIAVARPAFVYISHLHRIYLFGGKVAHEVGTDRMQIVEALVPTNEPTAAPTSNPSASPSSYPSETPTSMPSSNPTVSPTPTPTSDPTVNPSFYPSTSRPTKAPTSYPSMIPSVTPTNPPSQTPTEHPQHPTKDNVDDRDNETNESLLQWNSPIVIGCILAVFFAFILIACVGVCWYRRASKNQVDTAIQNMEGKVDAAAGALPQNETAINDALPQANATQPSLVYGESTAVKDKPQTFLGNGLSGEAELISDDESVLDGIVFTTKGEVVDAVQVQMAPMSGGNIAQFCEDAQFDAEVVGDDEVTRGGPSANRN